MAATSDGFLCCPSCRGMLTRRSGYVTDGTKEAGLHCAVCCADYRDNGSWIDFMNDRGLVFKTAREKFFRSLVARAYTPVTNMMFIPCGGAKSARNEVMGRIRAKDGDAVLETGIGYGENFLWLSKHYSGLRFYGLDIQDEMMSNCARNLLRWKISSELARADAMSLPYRDSVFDVVFHLGAINLFDDKRKAISEMIRVAKPGTHIVIADETEKAGRLFKIFTGDNEKVVPPVELIPQDVKNLTLSTIWKGYGYVIEFDVA